jgi:hypothetical protein
MLTGMGLNHFDLSSMENYGAVGRYSDKKTDRNLVASSESYVIGLQSIIRLHRKEMLVA